MTLPTGLTWRSDCFPQSPTPPKREAPAGARTNAPGATGGGGETGGAGSQQVPGKPGGSPPKGPDLCGPEMILYGGLFLAIFYFLLLRPQQKQEKQAKAMREALKKGDKVVTTGGMHAVVMSVEENVVTLKPGPDGPEMKFDASAIGRVLGDDAAAAKGK